MFDSLKEVVKKVNKPGSKTTLRISVKYRDNTDCIVKRSDISNIVMPNGENIPIQKSGVTLDFSSVNVLGIGIYYISSEPKEFLVNITIDTYYPPLKKSRGFGIVCPDCGKRLSIPSWSCSDTGFIHSKCVKTFNYCSKDSKHIHAKLNQKGIIVLDRDNTFYLYCIHCQYSIYKEKLAYQDSNIISKYNTKKLIYK